MTTYSRKKAGITLSPIVAKIVSPDAIRVPLKRQKKFSKTNVTQLKKILKKRGLIDTEVHVGKTIVALTKQEQSKDVANLLSDVVNDAALPVADRITASIELGKMPAQHAEKALVKSLSAEDDKIKSRVIQTLGVMGTKSSLTALKKVRRQHSEFVQRQLLFSKDLIAHRIGIKNTKAVEPEGTVWETDSKTPLKTIPMKLLDRKNIAEFKKKLKNRLYGIELSTTVGYRIRIDRMNLFLLLNKETAGKKGVDSIITRPLILGLILKVSDRTGDPAVHQVMMSTPRGRSIVVRGFRTDGTLLFDGTATKSEFTITGANKSGQCRYRLSGQLTANEVVWKQRKRMEQKISKKRTSY